jgi:hypothetical protein
METLYYPSEFNIYSLFFKKKNIYIDFKNFIIIEYILN